MESTYTIGEFAALAGVTIRTLHYYDETGLLKPTRREGSHYRQYEQADLLRLQQILTLKYLGFSLDEIETLLSQPAYDVAAALHAQKAAVEGRIVRLQSVAYALNRVAAMLDGEQAVDWAQVTAIIQGLHDAGTTLPDDLYPPEWAEWLRARAAQLPPDMLAEGEQAWHDLYDAFREKTHLPPEHPDVQALAAEMQRLGTLFTGGHPEVESALGELYRDVSQLPDAYRPPGMDQALQDFMYAALKIYREQQEGNKDNGLHDR